MVKLAKIVNEWVDLHRVAFDEIGRGTEIRNFADALTFKFRLQMSTGPLIVLLALDAGAAFGAYKGAEFVYQRAKQEVAYQRVINEFKDVKIDANLPPEYGGMPRRP